jgi:glutamyl endopeptidase
VSITCFIIGGLGLFPIYANYSNEVAYPYSNSVIDENCVTIGYNLSTNIEYIGETSDSYPTSSYETVVPSSYGASSLEIGLQTSYPFPPDDRVIINDTTSFPWRTICKLYITTQDDTYLIGSGAIIDEWHILTAGHCVYIHENGGWAKEVKIVPGMDGSYEPYGHTYASYFRAYTGWIEDEMVEHDFAVVTLQAPLGNLTGWMGRKTAAYTDSIYTSTLNLAGYPSDLGGGRYMYFDSDDGAMADEYNHWFWMDTAAGQSGSPVWLYDGEDRFILSVFAYEYVGGTSANFGTRLNQDKFDAINRWLEEDAGLTYDPPDQNYWQIIIPSIIIGVVVVIALGIVIYIVAKQKKYARERALEQYPSYPTYESQPVEYRTVSLMPHTFCPMCGRKITNPQAHYCVDCGYKLQ